MHFDRRHVAVVQRDGHITETVFTIVPLHPKISPAGTVRRPDS